MVLQPDIMLQGYTSTTRHLLHTAAVWEHILNATSRYTIETEGMEVSRRSRRAYGRSNVVHGTSHLWKTHARLDLIVGKLDLCDCTGEWRCKDWDERLTAAISSSIFRMNNHWNRVSSFK